jgi:hypothetical protein
MDASDDDKMMMMPLALPFCFLGLRCFALDHFFFLFFLFLAFSPFLSLSLSPLFCFFRIFGSSVFFSSEMNLTCIFLPLKLVAFRQISFLTVTEMKYKYAPL